MTVGKHRGIAGFDDIEQAAWPSFDLTSYSQPIEEMADAVLALLLGRTHAHAEIRGHLQVRGSTRRL